MNYLCSPKPFLRKREFSSAGSEHLPYKQRVGGSNPSTPTKQRRRLRNQSSFFCLCTAAATVFAYPAAGKKTRGEYCIRPSLNPFAMSERKVVDFGGSRSIAWLLHNGRHLGHRGCLCRCFGCLGLYAPCLYVGVPAAVVFA